MRVSASPRRGARADRRGWPGRRSCRRRSPGRAGARDRRRGSWGGRGRRAGASSRVGSRPGSDLPTARPLRTGGAASRRTAWCRSASTVPASAFQRVFEAARLLRAARRSGRRARPTACGPTSAGGPRAARWNQSSRFSGMVAGSSHCSRSGERYWSTRVAARRRAVEADARRVRAVVVGRGPVGAARVGVLRHRRVVVAADQVVQAQRHRVVARRSRASPASCRGSWRRRRARCPTSCGSTRRRWRPRRGPGSQASRPKAYQLAWREVVAASSCGRGPCWRRRRCRCSAWPSSVPSTTLATVEPGPLA